MPQTSYSQTQDMGFAGQLADLSLKRIVTGVNKEGSALPFGIGVTKSTNDGEYELPDAGGDKVYGIIVHSHDVDQRTLTGTQGVPIDGVMNVMEEGVCYVKVEDGVAEGGAVYCRHTANGELAQLGAFRSDADTANAAEVKGAKYGSSATAGNLAKVEFSKLVNLS